MGKLEHSYKVRICGESFQIKSDQPPQVIDRIAGYLDFKIQELGYQAVNSDKFRSTVLAALTIAGELFETKAQLEAAQAQRGELQLKLDDCQRQAERIREKAKNLSASLDKAIDPD